MTNDIKDIKPPVDIPNEWMWLWFLLAFILAASLSVWLLVLYLKRPRLKKENNEIRATSPWEKAYARLENLRLKNLMERAYLKPFYIELSDIVRHYLEEQFSIKAPEMTTEEFLESLKTSPALNTSQQQVLQQFLYECDMVKFAKLQPSPAEAQKSFDLAKSLIDQTHGI